MPDAPSLPVPPPAAPSADAETGASRRRALAEVILCSGYPSQVALGGLLRAAGLQPLTPGGHLSATFVFLLSLIDSVVLLALMIWLLRARGESPLGVFFGGRRVRAEAAFGVATLPGILLLVMIVTVVIRLVAPGLHNVPENPLEALLGTQAGLPAFLFVVIVAGGVREELQRAFLLHRFREDLGGERLGLMLTSLAFGLGHTIQGFDAAIITALLGAAWGAVYLARRSVVAGIVSHSLFNGGQLALAVLR